MNHLHVPAKQLVGLTLDGGWKVTDLVPRPPKATGGSFSVSYHVVHNDGRKAFLKALDYSVALQAQDTTTALQSMTAAYNYERNLCKRCKDKKLSRVVQIIAAGKVLVDANNPIGKVDYLIFERASGDIRSQLDAMGKFDLAWCLRSLHQIVVGLQQLHGISVAHQDLKPSNVLQFADNGSKIGDLGSSSCRDMQAPRDRFRIAGAIPYAPPELLYNDVPNDWSARRFGCDAYLLGSMIAFLFAKSPITALIEANMSPQHHWSIWTGSYDYILPYVREAMERGLKQFALSVPKELSEDLCSIVRQLCDPDPKLRGHPLNRLGYQNKYSLHRYVSHLNRLARKAELGLIGA